MNCQDFEAIINDLARDQIMDAASRQSALAHGEGCSECARRLRDERMLSAGLRHLAASASNEQAPERVEAALLVAFRERKEAVAAPRIAPRRLSRWAFAAAAAAALILAALITLSADRPAVMTPEETAAAEQDQIKPDEREPSENGSSQLVVQAPPASEVKKNSIDRKQKLQNYYAADRPRRARPTAKGSTDNNAPEADYEVATDFIPLTHRGSLAQLEGGQVVRVELPRSAMASFGLPVNLERAGERVKADVVVGNDGMARAIRFVR